MTTQSAVFFGHGNPMNAIEDNNFSRKWREIGRELQSAKAILVISAHYETQGVKIACAEQQKTIHDFYGFPDELFAVQYQARGDFDVARKIIEILGEGEVDQNWGLDHGAWSVLVHTHPQPKIPVLQLSLDRNKSAQQHYQMAQKLATLRDHGVLIVASGNIVHNLKMMKWRGGEYDWAQSFNDEIVEAIQQKDHQKIIDFTFLNDCAKAVPSAEHFLPLLYILAVQRASDKMVIFNNEIDLASIAMTSLLLRS